ncbi:MAG: calcium-binding protein, partial [Roseiflexaceae bacterium]
VDDVIDDNNITYKIVTAPATSTDPHYSLLNANDVSVVNVDDEVPGVIVSTISGPTTEAGGTATFTVKLSSQPSANVSIGLSSSDTTEGTVSPALLTFTPANWNTPRTVTVKGVDDQMVDGNITYKIITGAASSADPAYNGRAVADVTVVNKDDPGNADARRFIFLPLIRR